MRAAITSTLSASSRARACDAGCFIASRRTTASPRTMTRRLKKTGARLNSGLLGPNGSHLNAQCHLHSEAILLADGNAEVCTIQNTERIRTTHLLLWQRFVVNTFEGIDHQCDGFGDPM